MVPASIIGHTLHQGGALPDSLTSVLKVHSCKKETSIQAKFPLITKNTRNDLYKI